METQNIHVQVLPNPLAKQIFEKLYLDEETADVHFVFVSKSTGIAAHKSILSKLSEVFHAMFYGDNKEGLQVQIVDATAEGFKEFLQFFYIDQVKLTIDNIAEVMYLANKYIVPECLNVCDLFLQKELELDEICWAYELAITLGRKQLKHFCETKINECTTSMFDSNAFLNCSKDTLMKILDIINYRCCDGKEVFEACMVWAKHQCEQAGLDGSIMQNIRKQLSDCIYQIQFGVMSVKQLSECVQTYKGLLNDEELAEILAIISSDVHVPLQLFKRKIFFPQIGQSGMEQLLECVRYRHPCDNCGTDVPLHGLNSPDITSFESNKNILLGAISFIKSLRFANSTTTAITVIEIPPRGSSRANILFEQRIDSMTLVPYLNFPGVVGVVFVIPIALSTDTPARCKVLNFKSFNGFYGCTYCEHPGVNLPGKSLNNIRYPEMECANRTHEQTMIYARHQLNSNEKDMKGVKGATSLMALPHFDLIQGTPVDYMHCCLLGVTCLLLSLWFDSEHHNEGFYIGRKRQNSISTELSSAISEDLTDAQFFNSCIMSDDFFTSFKENVQYNKCNNNK